MSKRLTGYMLPVILFLTSMTITGCTLETSGTCSADLIDEALAGCYARAAIEPGPYDRDMFMQMRNGDTCPNIVSGYGWGLVAPYTFTGVITEPGHAELNGMAAGDRDYTEYTRMSIVRGAGRDILLTFTGYRHGSAGDWHSWPEAMSSPYTLSAVTCPTE